MAKKKTTAKKAAPKTPKKKAAKAKKAAARKAAARKAAKEKKAPKKKPAKAKAKEPTYEQIAAAAFEVYQYREAHGIPGDSAGDWHKAAARLRS